MVLDPRRTFLAYDNQDLIRDGKIPVKITKEYIPVSSFNENRLNNPPKGISYSVTRDDSGNLTQVLETKKLLPAEKLKIEIDFSKVMKSSVDPLISPGDLGFNPIVNIIGTPILSPIGLGGITEGTTEITYHILDAETIINQPIRVTQELIDTGVYECGGYPLSVFGIVKEVEEIIGEGEEPPTIKIGLDFTDEQLENIGKFSSGTWEGSVKKRIDGATNNDGLFGGRHTPEILFSDVAKENQEQLFIKIIRDNRKLKFRGDNLDASGDPAYPYKITGNSSVDATDKFIQIKTKDENNNPILTVGETLYITYSLCFERRNRQTLTHLGKVGQSNTIGVIGFMAAIESKSDIFDYQLSTYKVPSLVFNNFISNIDLIENIETIYTSDEDYKLSFVQYKSIKERERDNEDYDPIENGDCDEIEGWRVSQAITDKVKKFWAADYRGILLFDDGEVEIIFHRENIRDQNWFNEYLEGLPFTNPTGPNGQYILSDLEKNIEDEIELDDESGQAFDVSEVNNSMLFDREKVPYYRPFAQALKNVSRYNSENNESGVGIINLDLYNKVDLLLQDLSLFDLSFVEFKYANLQPLTSYNCEEEFDIMPHNYFSQNYNAFTEGPGAWYLRGTIERQVLEWRPSGGEIETYWKQETPYFCGDFIRNTRIYIERMGGPNLDNYSWIYVDTLPVVSSNISMDMNPYLDNSVVVFEDTEVNYGLSYHLFKDVYFYYVLGLFEKNIEQSHIKDPYDYNEYKIKGYNRILGDKYSYSNGLPITDDITRICKEGLDEQFWWTKEVYNNDIDLGFGLDFSDEIPTLSLPNKWYIRQFIIEYFYDEVLTSDDFIVSLYFEDTDVSIDNISIPTSQTEKRRDTITFSIDSSTSIYYYGRTLKFFGEFWKKANIRSIKLRLLDNIDNPNHQRDFNLIDYKIVSGQNSVIFDSFGRIIVFYSNENSGNIDAVISYDEGRQWEIHKGIIRLIEGESATLPFVVKNINGYGVNLFYVLNDEFLMHKVIDTRSFHSEDCFIEPKVPESYKAGDYNIELNDPESDYWGNFSVLGQDIRRSVSYFVAGNSGNSYFQEQMEINSGLDLQNESLDITKQQFKRFDFKGSEDNLKEDFKNIPYAVHIDSENNFRVFMVINNALSIKRSDGSNIWVYDAEEVNIHKEYVDSEINRGREPKIHNIQIVRNDYDSKSLSILYFSNNMLFMRHLDSYLLFSDNEEEKENIKEYLEVSQSSANKPIFLVGNMPEGIRNKKIEELVANIPTENSELLINIPYNAQEVEKFDERFNVDMETQVYGYTTSQGLIRIFYKDSNNLLNCIDIDSLLQPTPEVWYVEKEN